MEIKDFGQIKFPDISKSIRATNLKEWPKEPNIFEGDPIRFDICLKKRSEHNL